MSLNLLPVPAFSASVLNEVYDKEKSSVSSDSKYGMMSCLSHRRISCEKTLP